MTRLAGDLIISEDFQLPDVVTTFGNGTNTITATSWTNLPTMSCIAAMTNPHPSDDLIVLVTWAAWLHASASTVRCCPAVSGSLTLAAGVGAGRAAGWGEIPLTAVSGNPQQRQGSATFTLPQSSTAATFTMQAMRDAATGTQYVNYPVIQIIPLYYDL